MEWPNRVSTVASRRVGTGRERPGNDASREAKGVGWPVLTMSLWAGGCGGGAELPPHEASRMHPQIETTHRPRGCTLVMVTCPRRFVKGATKFGLLAGFFGGCVARLF